MLLIRQHLPWRELWRPEANSRCRTTLGVYAFVFANDFVRDQSLEASDGSATADADGSSVATTLTM
jgi:hypothetical protein